jgi:uncharacterized Zn finger protein (UPF0148 family)
MKHCPKCGTAESYDDVDDFCPIHQTRLVYREETDPGSPDAAQDSATESSGSTKDETRQEEGSTQGESLMDRLKRMFGRGRGQQGSEESGEAAEPVLPKSLTDQGWSVARAEPVLTTTSADFFPVGTSLGARALFKRYRSGSDTSVTIYRTLDGLQSARLVPLLFSGNVKAGGAEFDSELLALNDLQPLSFQLLENPTPGEAGIVWFLGEALQILEDLNGHGLTCLQLHPRSLTLTGDGTLLLNDFSQLYPAVPEDRFIPVLRNLELEYAAPEVVNRRVLATAKSAMYSVGAVAALMAWGFVPSQTAILSGDLDFAVLPERIAHPLMGLLYPDPVQRWGSAELAGWLTGESVPAPDWSRLKPGASEKAIVLNGQAVYLPENLAPLLYRDPDSAGERLDEILDWLTANPRVRDIALEVRRQQAAGRHRDWLVLRLAFLLNGNEPRSWRGISLDEELVAVNLAELGRRAVVGDKESIILLSRLYEANLNEVFIGGEL